MNKKLKIGLIIIIALIVITVYFAYNHITLSSVSIQQMKSCVSDADCVPVTCSCYCNGCGGFPYQDVINEKYVSVWYYQQNCTADIEICLDQCCTPRTIVCENNICGVRTKWDELMSTYRKLSFPEQGLYRTALKSGEFRDIPAFGVQNIENSTIVFTIEIQKYDITSSTFSNVTTQRNIDGSFMWDDTTQKLEAGEIKTYSLTLKAEATKGDYMYKLIIKKSNGEEYDSTVFFVTVT
jgi:hypothetical protein